jgi:hypothetical protein
MLLRVKCYYRRRSPALRRHIERREALSQLQTHALPSDSAYVRAVRRSHHFDALDHSRQSPSFAHWAVADPHGTRAAHDAYVPRSLILCRAWCGRRGAAGQGLAPIGDSSNRGARQMSCACSRSNRGMVAFSLSHVISGSHGQSSPAAGGARGCWPKPRRCAPRTACVREPRPARRQAHACTRARPAVWRPCGNTRRTCKSWAGTRAGAPAWSHSRR